MKTKSVQNERGSTIAVVIITMVVLIAVVAVATEYTTTVNRHVQRGNTLETAVAVGDTCLEILFAEWRDKCREAPTTALATNKFKGTSAVRMPSSSLFPNLSSDSITNPFVKAGINPDPDSTSDYDPNYTISNYKVVAVSPELTALPAATPGANSTPVPNDSTAPLPMLGQLSSPIVTTILPSDSGVYNYVASADITLPALGTRNSGGTGKGNVVAKVRRVFQKQGVSPLDFAIFYIDPLEIHPGAPFTVTGAVHTNSNLWTGHNTLTFADRVSFGSNWNIGFMPEENSHNGEVPTAPNYPAGMPPTRVDPFELPVIGSIDNANTSSKYREIIEPPVTGLTDPYKDQRYWNQAGIVIEVSDNTSSTTKGGVKGPSGYTGANGADFINLYTTNPTTGVATQITSGDLYTMFSASGVITTNQTFQDNREGATQRVATLDVSKIVTNPSSGNPAYIKTVFGGSDSVLPIVYMYNKSAGSASTGRRAIRVKNASKIPTTGLTIASNNPVYIQGDFNTGGTGTTVPSNNSSNLNSNGTYKTPDSPPNPQVNNYTRAPAAVLADAVNILSSNWDDSKSTAALASRVATATTINAAIISGTVPSNNGNYSGGAENFPRFLEDWSNKPVNYYGSMVELYKSQQAIGKWINTGASGNVYNPPARNWFYDTNFKTIRPKGSATMGVIHYIKGKWTVQ